ncbi:MAG: hypothetical protein EOO62_23425 [Hymenobacter sp.]|nr:MAG: hypothetical protein EOO62_23425 [Hymenobacter sp.]
MVLDLLVTDLAQRYQVRTTTAVQVAQMRVENELLYVVEQRILAKNEHGYLLQLDVLNATQKATDLFSRVTAEVNQATRRLVLQINEQGRLLQVKNQSEVLQQWQAMQAAIRAKHADEPTVQPFLDAFAQQLAVPGSMEPNLRDKGIYGALLPGVYGQDYHPQVPVLTKRCITGFFHELDLPLVLATTAEPAPADASPLGTAVQVTTTATLDEEAFAATDFRRLMRSLVDDYRFPVDLTLNYQAQHLFDARTGVLLRSQQYLVAEVPGVYHNALTHELLPQPTP